MRSMPMILLFFLFPAAATAQVTLITDKAEYVQGEVVEITIHNGTAETVDLVSSPWYCIVRTDGPYPGCVGLPVILSLPAGETWVAYHDTGFLPDPPGEYTVQPASPVADPPSYTLTAAVADARVRWSTIKGTFR